MTQPMAETKELIKRHSIHEMVNAYDQAKEEVESAFNHLKRAKQRLSIFGGYRDHLFPNTNNHMDYDIDRSLEDSLTHIKSNAWRGIFERSQLENIMSAEKKRKFNAQFEEPSKLPDISVQVVTDTIASFAESIDTLLEEVVTESFNYLRPRMSDFKTNDKYEVGGKVILDYAVDYNKYYTSFHAADNIRSMDNVFHLLDGKGHVKYPGDAVTKIQDAIRSKRWTAETEYFDFKWFKKGTMHIKFKRLDLLSELNRIGGKGLVKREESA